jgi:hypothetical protein
MRSTAESITTSTRGRRALTAVALVAVACACAVPSTASAAGYRNCEQTKLNKYAGSFVGISAKAVGCSRAVKLAGDALARQRAARTTGLKMSGYRCRLRNTYDASEGGDPFAEYLCVRGASKRIKILIVN